MTTQRMVLDTRGKDILTLFTENINAIGALNQLAASPADGGVYHGPNEEDVNINYPRDTRGWNRVGRSPGPYESYHVREITLQHGFDDDGNRTGFEMVSKEQNDGTDGANHVRATSSDSIFQGKSSTTLLRNHGAYSEESGNANPSKFMELKGRKSLFTLLQETMGAFFDNKDRPVYRDPANDTNPNQSNKYGDGYQAYDFQYMATQGPSFVDAPTTMDFTWQALAGFNLGQVTGSEITIEDRIRTEAQNITREIFDDFASAAGADDNQFIADYYHRIAQTVAPVDRISQLYVPGWGRPSENWRTKKPLSENLNQNILLPPDTDEWGNPTNVAGSITPAKGPGFGDTAATFRSLYTRNRSGKAGNVDIGNPIFNNGMIAGTAINLLQEPGHITAAQIKADSSEPIPQEVSVPFTFEEDDAQYLTYPKRETGFTSNGPTTTTDPSRMEPAVTDIATTTPDGQPYHLGDTTVRLTQGQYFPFAFSTVNKKRNSQTRLQVCYLQAIINSLGESYTPTWNSRHFFGRTEQTHTYTFTDRTIDISFTIFANEMRQLQNVYERVVWLAQQCYPDYNADDSRMAEGPLVAMRVGDLFQYKAGIIRSLAYDWMFGTGKWELTSGMRMPQGCTVTMSYQVIHDNVPSRDTDFYGGPQGGLNSATERYRTIQAYNGGKNAFGAFADETLTDHMGFGQRLIDSGVPADNLNETSFIEEIKAANQAWMLSTDAAGNVTSSANDKRAKSLAVPGGYDPTLDT